MFPVAEKEIQKYTKSMQIKQIDKEAHCFILTNI